MQTGATGSGLFTRFKSIFVNTGEIEEPNISVMETSSYYNESPVEETPEIIAEDIPIVRTAEEPYDMKYSAPILPEEPVLESLSSREIVAEAVIQASAAEPDLDIRFASNFIESGGKFIYSETISEAVENLKMLKKEMGWAHVFCWENEIKDAFSDNGFQKGAVGFTIETSDVAISMCESLSAEEGNIILNPKQASRRRLPCFPKTHIIFADVSAITSNEEMGLLKFYSRHNGELPSIIKLGTCNTGHFYDKQRLILNSEGPEDIYVFLVDQRIPPSTRP